ncbi:MAG TPA: hypothetical protein PLA41_02145 [Candidatus Pacearchaeota archaeon]|nr:hypothetical protein [Candidatus Parcubacteria bacterium]HOU45928.1 hypothetical protein [Candidatus Pacearchaeota archaeon]HPM08221.1 hypothetical protein [Candidatus Pacearchaeota archaeon]HQI74459.1 hypothetical protein [Candidatus Pacearchaeota archaeon]
MESLQEFFQIADKPAILILIVAIIILAIFYFYNFRKPKGINKYIEKKWEHNKNIIEAMGENAWSIDEIKKMIPLSEIDKAPWIEMDIEVLSLPCPFTPGKKIKDTHFLYYDQAKKKWRMMLIKGILGFSPKEKQIGTIIMANPNYLTPNISDRIAFEISYYCKKGRYSNSRTIFLRCSESNQVCHRFNSKDTEIFISKKMEDDLAKKNILVAVERLI